MRRIIGSLVILSGVGLVVVYFVLLALATALVETYGDYYSVPVLIEIFEEVIEPRTSPVPLIDLFCLVGMLGASALLGAGMMIVKDPSSARGLQVLKYCALTCGIVPIAILLFGALFMTDSSPPNSSLIIFYLSALLRPFQNASWANFCLAMIGWPVFLVIWAHHQMRKPDAP